MGSAELRRFDSFALPNYLVDGAYDEMFEVIGQPREHYIPLLETLKALPADEIRRRKHAADLSLLNQGITFTVYGREEGTERIFPYDLLPRIITSEEWNHVERGLTQRITALNLFLRDIYNEGRILADGIVPREIVYSCKHFRRQMRGLQVPRNVYIAVVGSDLIRLPSGEFVVLEDNLRVSDRTLHSGPPEYAALVSARGQGRAHHCSVESRGLQLRLFRTCLPGASDGH
jgi:uncharacterized circularly permuted ATP-grasp superfamily protein